MGRHVDGWAPLMRFGLGLAMATFALASITCAPVRVAAAMDGVDTPDWTAASPPPTSTLGGYDAVETADTHELVMAFWSVSSTMRAHDLRMRADALVASYGPDVAAFHGAAIVVRFFGTARDARGAVRAASFAYVVADGAWRRSTDRKRIAQLVLLGL